MKGVKFKFGFRMIPTAIKAAGTFALALLFRGRRSVAPREVAFKRLSVCWECPSMDRESKQCLKCLCYLPLKVSLTTEKCPEGKWGIAWYIFKKKSVKI